MDRAVYPMTANARTVLAMAAVVMIVLVALLPFGVWILLSLRRARVEVSDGLIEELNALRCKRRLIASEVTRLGLYRAPTPGGIGGAGARVKLGGPEGLNLCWEDAAGKTRWICLSYYEEPLEILDRAREMTGLPVEELKMGFFGVKWPAE